MTIQQLIKNKQVLAAIAAFCEDYELRYAAPKVFRGIGGVEMIAVGRNALDWNGTRLTFQYFDELVEIFDIRFDL